MVFKIAKKVNAFYLAYFALSYIFSKYYEEKSLDQFSENPGISAFQFFIIYFPACFRFPEHNNISFPAHISATVLLHTYRILAIGSQ